MKVKNKVIIISCISFLIIILVTSLVFNLGIFKYIDNVENSDVNDNFKVLNTIIAREHNNLQRTVLDWAHWDDTYNYIYGINKKDYIENNLQEASLRQLNINFMLFYDTKGNIINSNTRNIDSKRNELLKVKLSSKTDIKLKGADNSNICLLNLSGEMYIVSAADITTSDEKAVSNGRLIIGKQLDKEAISYISSVIQNGVKIVGNDDNISNSNKSIKNGNYIDAYRTVKDINGNNSIIYSINMFRNEYKLGKLYFKVFVLIFVVFLIMICIISIRLFDRTILRRLKTINDFFMEVTKTKDTKKRLNLNGKDEISNIAASINKMLTEIERRNTELLNFSYNDKLTGLRNRAYIDKCFDELDSKDEDNYSIIMGDVNGLKLVNDTYGHRHGDKLIFSMADIIKGVCEEDDIIGRWGGDEFIVIVKNKGSVYNENLIHNIRNRCREIRDFGFAVSIALGIADNKELKSADTVMNTAEQRMYRCKLIEVNSSRNATIKSLEKTLYEKHSETEQHTQRVKYLSTKLGEKINLSEDKLNELELLGILHDIGKIGIPEHILMKQGKLTNEEWETMKRHTEIGYRIAKATPGVEHVANEILCHHERYNGTGYPRGLKGEEIPILSRIINIVDSFDVMTHKRVYKDAYSLNYAIDELKRCSGTQFDPKLTEEFIKLIDKFKILLTEEGDENEIK